MSTNRFIYRAGAELPGLTLPWQTETSQDVYTDLDLSSGYTFTVTLTDSAGAVQLTKTSDIVGFDGSVVVTWAEDDLDLTPGDYTLHLRAFETVTSKDRDYAPNDPVMVTITG